MPVWEILGLAVALGLDAMSVAAAVGVRWHGARQKFRLAWHAGLLQFLMPLAGWAAGRQLAELLASWGAWLAGALVFAVGVKMLYEALQSRPGAVEETVERAAEHAAERRAAGGRPASSTAKGDPTRGWSLVVLSVATSLDALVVGFSLGLRGSGRIWWAAAVIGVVAAAMSLAGVAIGKRVGAAVGRPAEVAGALVLMALGASFPLW